MRVYANKFKIRYLVLIVGFAFFPTRNNAQRRVQSTDDSMRYQRDFLELFYPELSGKKYWVTLETAARYDEPENTDRVFLVDIGDGAKYAVLECCRGGELATAAPKMPDDPELGPHPPPPVPPPLPNSTRQRPLNVDARGAVHPYQYLSTVFVFDSQGRLKGFTAQGAAARESEAIDVFWEKLQRHPEMTDAELIAGYKEAGAKYAIGDRKAFKRDLPISKLEQFLGRLEILRTDFSPTTDERLDKLGAFSDCSVLLLTANGDGVQQRYQAHFEATRGALVGLYVVRDKDAHLHQP